ncbi:BnaC06g10280D [Brassica napus]|uniref:BnaC06g10280D protein n=1 Tax=Brassica napus TaxID=3708 RepID=A0A078GZR6_BRANA|nr:BnaC06g10280D [Brassica napus]
MSVIIGTTVGDLLIDLFIEKCPKTCLNFLKLCKIKYYHNSLFHTVNKDSIAVTGDPTGTGTGGDSIFQVLSLLFCFFLSSFSIFLSTYFSCYVF